MEFSTVPAKPVTSELLLAEIARDQHIIIPAGYDPELDRLIDEKEAAPLCGLAVRTLQDLRLKGGGPSYVAVSPGKRGKVRYTARGCIVWRQERICWSTSDAAVKR